MIAPKWLDAEAKILYKELYPICKGEESLLIAYCCAYAEFKLATITLQKEGRYITTKTGFKLAHPAAKMVKQSISALNQLSVKLGLDKSEHVKDIPNLKKWHGLMEEIETR